MKRILFFLISVLMCFTASAQTAQQKALADAYLEKYAEMAVEEMHRSGVPASVTLAQGMLESSYGRSELAVKVFFGTVIYEGTFERKEERYERTLF